MNVRNGCRIIACPLPLPIKWKRFGVTRLGYSVTCPEPLGQPQPSEGTVASPLRVLINVYESRRRRGECTAGRSLKWRRKLLANTLSRHLVRLAWLNKLNLAGERRHVLRRADNPRPARDFERRLPATTRVISDDRPRQGLAFLLPALRDSCLFNWIPKRRCCSSGVSWNVTRGKNLRADLEVAINSVNLPLHWIAWR